MSSLVIELVQSKLGTRGSRHVRGGVERSHGPRRRDGAAVGGFPSLARRVFVQYRDAAAPFGYDATQLISPTPRSSLYHDRFAGVRRDKTVGLKLNATHALTSTPRRSTTTAPRCRRRAGLGPRSSTLRALTRRGRSRSAKAA